MPEPLTVDGRQLFITKTKFLWGRQCLKLIWTAFNRNDLLPAPDAANFGQGHEIDALAKHLFPHEDEVSVGVTEFDPALRKWLPASQARKPIFSPAFMASGGFARRDILNPVAKDTWDIIKVTSGTEVKDVNLLDLAFQAFAYEGAGIKIRRSFVLHVNRHYVRRGPVDPKKLFKQEDVTKDVSVLTGDILAQLGELFSTIHRKQEPEIQIGPHCSDPHPCPLQERCWAFLPAGSVFDLYYGGKKCWRLLDDGITQLKDIPDDVKLTDRQSIQRTVARTGQPHIKGKALARFLKRLQYPVGYLDFETFNTAIPLFDGLRPYDQCPFQFSLHRAATPDSKPEHHAFLAEGGTDPRPEFLNRLRDCIGEEGSVVVYNRKFEKAVLEKLAKAYPDHAVWIGNVKRRFVDLLEPFQVFDYYHPDQHGSASIKAVLPVMTGRSYADLEIHAGGQASLEYLRVHFGDVPKAERRKVRKQLERYCGQDTEGMVWIVDALRRLVG